MEKFWFLSSGNKLLRLKKISGTSPFCEKTFLISPCTSEAGVIIPESLWPPQIFQQFFWRRLLAELEPSCRSRTENKTFCSQPANTIGLTTWGGSGMKIPNVIEYWMYGPAGCPFPLSLCFNLLVMCLYLSFRKVISSVETSYIFVSQSFLQTHLTLLCY